MPSVIRRRSPNVDKCRRLRSPATYSRCVDDDLASAELEYGSEGDELLQEERDAIEEPDPNPDPVSYSGTDFDVEGLVRRLNRGDIIVPSFGIVDETIETKGFQRRFVWRKAQMDRFIESLLIGYPIPGIFLVQQKDKRYLVLDGQQRLRTLQAFYRGLHNAKEFSLQNVASDYKDLTYEALDPELRRTIDNTFVQATIVKTDGQAKSLDTIYQIFERLNSGGTQLTPHEIRVALYAGRFVEFLTKLNELDAWRELYGPLSPRLRDQEILLRFVALYVSPGSYKRPLKKYLNDFVADHRDLEGLDPDAVGARFSDAVRLLNSAVGPSAIRARRSVNAALAESLFVGLARRLDLEPAPSELAVAGAVERLLKNSELDRTISQATADEESVRTRLAITTTEFSKI